MHDIGKVKTPTEILNKPDKLDEREFEIMKRHTVDGAEILRRTPEMPTLAPIVAFEHHLRLDGTGLPRTASSAASSTSRPCCAASPTCTTRCDRSATYQQAFPTDRILAVLQRNDGKQFDQNLVRRFAQLVGIYPAGNLVRLKTGEIAVVMKAHAPDPFRPRVKVVRGADEVDLERPHEINLWEVTDEQATSIEKPLDPAEYGIDPLSYLQ